MALRPRPTEDEISSHASSHGVTSEHARVHLLRRWHEECVDDMKIKMTESAGTPSNTRAVLRDILDLLMEMVR